MPTPVRSHRQPALPGPLVHAAHDVLATLDLPTQHAATWVHAGAIAQHAAQIELVPAEAGLRSKLDRLAALHPCLEQFAQLPEPPAAAVAAIERLWGEHTLIEPDGQVEWYSYPLGDLYQALSAESVKGRALCQTPWWVGELLLEISYDRAQELWITPQVVDPACGTGHLLVEAFRRTRSLHRFYDGYSPVAPYRHHWPTLERALDAVHGVDLDPYAVAIAGYRLITLAWAQVRHRAPRAALAELPVHVACADALLDENEPLLERGRYHVVLANPPYITPKDKTANDAIRRRYRQVCNGRYSLALPFHALFNELLVPGGWCAQLTANSFMKREFGRAYVEKYLTEFDLEWVIDTSGAYIPGHGTPTLILVNRNQPPSHTAVRTVCGIKGEPEVPADPSTGLVWSAIRDAVERRESAERFGRGAQTAAQLAGEQAGRNTPQQAAGPRPRPPVERAPAQMTIFDLLAEAA